MLHDCITALAGKIAKIMEVSPQIRRMDSMMIAANIRKLSRVELLYTCVAKLATYCHKNWMDTLIVGMDHYHDPNDFNRTFYYSNSSEAHEQFKSILGDADHLLEACGADFEEVTEYQLLISAFRNRP